MLRELITWVLNTYLGKYLEDFNPAQLTVALLSGEVELENVPFRKDALRGFGLPLETLSGNIGKIKLQVPVRQFRSAPWCLVIENVYVVIGPKNLENWDEEKEKAADLDYKISQLDNLEAKWRAQREACLESGYYASSYSGWLSYGAGLATNIIENLQLKINNVHIRYEDSVTIPNSRIACGITISSLSAQSCDSNWCPGFTTAWNQNVASFKLVELQSFSFYWDRLTNSKTFGSVPSSDLTIAMQTGCIPKDHRHIINPISAKAHFKRDRSETPLRTRSRPRLSCEVSVNEISLSLTDYVQMVECIKGLDNLTKLQTHRLLRPGVPVKNNSRLWWQYAGKCHGFTHETYEQKLQKAKENIKYIKLYSKLILNPNENLTLDEKELKNHVEKERFYDDLRVLREVCFLYSPNNIKLKEQEASQGKGMLYQFFPQWWGWYGNNSSPTSSSPTNPSSPNNVNSSNESADVVDNISLAKEHSSLEDEILNALEGSVENNSLLKRDAVFGKFDFTLDGGLINIGSEKCTSEEVITMMEMHFDNLKLSVETRPRSGSHLLALSLGSVCVKDLLTPNTEFPDLIKPQVKDDSFSGYSRYQSQRNKKENLNTTSSEDKEPWFQLQYERKPLVYNTDYRLVVKSKSLDVVYNMEALRWFIDFFSKPLQVFSARQKLEEMTNNTKLKLIKNWKNMLEGDLGQRKSWSLEIDVSAPQIIFVENFSNKNTSIVLIDFGRFQLLKNSTQDKIRQHKCNHKSETNTIPKDNSLSKLSQRDSEEDDDAFMTPCSTPPGSETSDIDSPTLTLTKESVTIPELTNVIINEDTGLEDAFHDKIYDKYTIDLTDLQVLVCKGKERWNFASTKGSSALHVLDRFNISLHVERRVVHTIDPEYPALTLYGTLPKLIAHVNEQKIGALCEIVDIISSQKSISNQKLSNNDNIKVENNTSTKGINDPDITSNDQADVTSNEISNLIVLQFVIDQMSLEVQSRGRSIAELQVTGVRAGLNKRSYETNLSLSVHGLLLVDAIQSFGQDFELLVASHRHVGMDSISGSLKQSEPCSPTSPASPDPLQNKRPTSPQTITRAITSLQRANSATWSTLGDLDALITVEVNLITSDNIDENLQIANIHFNNLDIIANQETTVELLGFINRVFPSKNKVKLEDLSKLENKPISKNAEIPASSPLRMEITFDFHRLNVLVLRALMRDSFMVGRKVGTFTMSEARIHATLGSEISVQGSLGGLQILDLTPEGVNHQRILSVGKDPLTEPPDLAQDLMTSLTQEVYGNKNNIFDQRQALSFDVSRNMQSIVDIKIRMASVWYTHCARFMQELSWCATEFKHYLKNFAKSIKDKATDMAYGLVQPTSNDVDSTKNSLAEITIKYSCKDSKKKKSKKVVIRLDVVLDTPVLVVPRSSCSSQVLVAHLGKISITNNQQNINNNYQKHNNDDDINNFSINDYDNENIFEMDDDDDNNDDEHYQKKNTDNFELQQNCDVYNIDVRNMNLFSLDTSRRKGFRLSALPRAEDFYSCQKDAVAILHDTALSLRIIKFFDDKRDIMDKSLEEDLLHVEGSVTQPLQISLSRKQYEQLLETVDNIFKVPPDLMRPPTEVPTVIESATTKDELDSSFQSGKTFDERSSLGVDSIDRKTALMPRVTFTLPIFIIQLKNEHDNPLIEITFREFNVQYEKQNIYETHIKVSLRSILMEDLLCPRDSKYRQMVVSSAQSTTADRSGTGVSSLSCPDLVRSQMYDEAITGSLPDNLEITAGFDKIQSSISSNVKVQRSRIKLSNLDCPGTPPPSPQPRAVEDNLVIYSATIVDSNCPGLNTQHKSLRQTSSIDFNSLDLIISVERWFLLLNFFGLLSDEDEDRSKVDGHDERYTNEQGKGNTELEITVRSLTLVLVRNEAELAKANVSNAFFIVSQHNVSKIVEGRLGSVSLFDLTTYGRIYRERFLTSGTEALKFIYKRDVEKSNQRTLNKDAKLKIFMSSVRYVHTKRFVMEIQAFIKEFLQLQTPVIRKIKSSDSKYSLQQRPTQLGLEINAGSPIILLPLSFESNQVIVADLGEFSLRNSFHLASEPDVISKKSDTSLLDEILDVMQIDLVNTNLFSGDRLQKNQLTTATTTATRGSSTSLSRMDTNDDTDIRFDMGSYWIVKKGKNLLKEKCHLKLQIERNMDSWKSHNCPDVSVQGMLSRLHGVLDTEQYKLVRGFLSYNLGEQIDDIYNSNSFSLGESRVNLNVAEPEKRFDKLIWTNMSINIDLEDVSLVLNWLPTDINSINDYEALACINFIRSCLKIDSFSDGSQDIDLVSQEILVTDSRFNEQDTQKNVFTNILQPIRKQMDNNLVQAEVHSRRRHDHCKFTILLNNMRLMAIIDWIENIQDYLSQNTELPYGSLLRSQNTEISNSQMNLSDDKTPMEVILNITDSELVFVEKTDQIDTNAVILKSTTVVSFKPSDNVKPISVNLNHLEVFSCILGFESETALSIIDPITINLDVKNQAIEIQIQKQFCIRLSYHDVKMFTRMLQSLPKQTRTAQTTTQQKNSPSSSSADINKFLVTKLCALGFHKTDCERALQLCRNQLDEAALWLTQNTEPVNTVTTYEKNKNILEIHSIIIHANCISICVIDDCKDADVPLLELSLSQLEFKQELSKYLFSPQSAFCAMGVSGFCCGRLKAIIASDYYNRHLSGWEPIIESWECDSNWNYSVGQTGTEQSRLNLAICSDKLLKFDITSTLVELWQLVRKNWTQDYYEGCNNTSSSVIQSPSGYKRRSPFIPFSLRNNTGENLWFKILLTSPGGITRTEISGGSGNQWIQVKPNETVPFSFGQQNKLRHLDSHKLNLHQVLVHVDGWSQVGPVSVDKVGVFFRHAHCESTTYSNMPKARIVFAVTLEGSAQKLVTVRSALRVINRLEDVILLKMDHPEHYLGITEWPNAKTAMIKSMENFSIPLSHVHACLYFKPIQSLFSTIDDKNGNKTISNNSNQRRNDNDYWFNQKINRNSLTGREGRYFQFCDKSITWRDCVDTLEICQEQRLCKGNREKLYNVLVTTKRDGYPQKEATLLPGHTITLMPPLRINNLLCCDLIYKVTNNAQGRIQASETAYIYEVNLDENINLNITLDGYQVSGQISIPSGHIGTVEPKLRLLDIHNRDLQLRACIQSIKGNGMEISISAPFWLVNKTGLPLVFRQEGVSLAASGQFDENEKARVVSPLMFSFSDPDASPALEVRLGNRYGTSPPWCQSLSLHKDIVHRQLKAANTNETFIIGVEVRRGRGRYSRTSVVTFSPRFQLYNRSSHKLKFAQKCFIMKPSDPDTRKTIIDAVPGCHFPFHWPRSDQEPLLCVKLDDIDNCCWSSGIPINEAQSLYINIRNEHGDMHFLRLEVILQGATYFLLFGDARTLPPPIRLDNYSEVPIKFFQYACKREWRTTVKPHSSVSYTLDEPIGSQCIQIEAPGGDSFVYSLRDLNMSNTLTYSNFIYIAFKGTFQSPSLCENLHLATEIDIESQHLVLGVKDKRVILMRKLTGDRSQLWLMNSFEQLEHEGSSPPTEPGKKSSNLTPRFVLDIERALNPMDYTSLVVRPTNKQRQLTQTWKFVNNRLMCGHANMCVQARNGIFGLRPGSDAVLGRIDSETQIRSEHSLPIEQHIERQKLRPGSGQLSVTIKMDGPIRTIQIKDVKYQSDLELQPDPLWKHASNMITNNTKQNNSFQDQKVGLVDEYFIKLHLTKGVGISIISKAPFEELAYITLEKIALEVVATPNVRSVDLNVGDMQIDNQLVESPCPILLYTIKTQLPDVRSPSALIFNAKMLPSPNTNAVIFERLIITAHPFALYLEERLVLRAAVFLGLGSSKENATSLADESEYEAQQVATKILAANAKRYYFADFQISPSQIRLSVITASKLSTQLLDLKKKLGLTLIKFEDALIEFDRFTDKHHFETLEIYLRAIKSHYKNQLKWHAASILGSVDFLGNPLGFANDLSEGVSGLLFEGSVKSLVKNVTHGISNSTAKLTETISDGLGRVVLDEQDNETRQKILEVPSGANSSGEHLAAGLKGFGFGLLGGVTSIVKYTYEGAQSDGLHGFISGLGKGIVGTVTKPLIGVLDLASETANAVRETSKSAHRVLPERKRLPRCVSGAPGGLLPSYSHTQAKGQQHLFLINKRNFSEQLMYYEPNLVDDRDGKLRLLISTEYVRIFSRSDEETTIILSHHLSEVLSCHPVTVNRTSDNHKLKKPQFYIEISSSLPHQYKRPRVRCQTEEMAERSSRQINYAKSVYDEREHTLNFDQTLED